MDNSCKFLSGIKSPFGRGSLGGIDDARPFLPPRLICNFYEAMHRMDKKELHEDALQDGAAQFMGYFLPKKDIEFEVILAEAGLSKKSAETPLKDKEPSLQELRTWAQVSRHFIPLPGIAGHLDEWISKDRDLLFLGPPFCGKTSLLTYLSFEAKRRDKERISVVRLKIHEDFSAKEAEGAVTRLVKHLDHIGAAGRDKRTVLVIDDVHKSGTFLIARELLRSPRNYHVWGAARAREMEDILSGGEKNPWNKKDIVKDACDLTGEEDRDYFFEHVLKPILMKNGRDDQIDEVKAAIKSIGGVPVRSLCQVWKLIKESPMNLRFTKGEENTLFCNSGEGRNPGFSSEARHDKGIKYAPLIFKSQTGVDEIVKSVLPQTIPGLRALVIADFLNCPPWDLLIYLLSSVEGFGHDLAAGTIDDLRKSSALMDDPEEPRRSFMYGQARECVRRPGNLADWFKGEIWNGIRDFLKEKGHLQEAACPSDKLFAFWLSLSEEAKKAGQKDIALSCAEAAIEYASSLEQEVNALFQTALAMNFLQGEWGEDAVYLLTRAVEKSMQLEKDTIDSANAKAMLGILFLNSSPPDIEKALSFLHEAKDACEFLGDDNDAGLLSKILAIVKINQAANQGDNEGDSEIHKAIQYARQAASTYHKLENIMEEIESLYLLAYCLLILDEPDWAQAIFCYRKVLELLKIPDQKADRARTLYQLAYCLYNQPEPDWAEALKASKESCEILKGSVDGRGLADHLIQLAWLYHNQPDPDWDRAIALYGEALEILKDSEDSADMGMVLYMMGYCLQNRPDSDWTGAAAYYRNAFDLQGTEEQSADRALTLFHLAYCLQNQPEPDWPEAIAFYSGALGLQTDQRQRAETLYLLGFCLYNQHSPDWLGAIDCFRQAIGLMTDPDQQKDRAELLYHLAYCLHNQPYPDWFEAISYYQGALDLLTNPDQKKDREKTLYQLAYCLQNRPEPDWAEAIAYYIQALGLLTDTEDRR
ncbi:AAA family ATPase, partial [bacterium]|nr:AAA family ATPase [bacterium]